MGFHEADAVNFWNELQVNGNAVPVHDIRRMVLKVSANAQNHWLNAAVFRSSACLQE